MLKYNLVTVGDTANITVLINGELFTASSEHPNFKGIVAAVLDGQEDVAHMFDLATAVSKKFEVLSERVTVRHGQVYFDGDVVDNSLTNQILRFFDADEQDFKPLVAFMEKVMTNPSENSRNELFEWLRPRDFTITDDGDIVAYKGVRVDENGVPRSTVAAPERDQVSVNGELVTGYVPNEDGSVVTMPRAVVDPAENNHCSVGLHVGTYGYAQNFTGHVLEVHVNPRDVVSVTSDSNREKIRVCRYKVVGVVGEQIAKPVVKAIDVTKATTVKADTRQNHLSQQRYPKGHPKAGQFIPKGA